MPSTAPSLALLVKRGSFVDAGSPVATIEPSGSDLLAVLYVGASDGKQVRAGHDARSSRRARPRRRSTER